MVELDFGAIERKWQDRWAKGKVFSPRDDSGEPDISEDSEKPKFYVLEMFPYPSGTGLHMGHAWNYTIGDILARFKIMKGFDVLHPMGFDALGLPAENAAIKAGTHPEEYTNGAIANYIRQQRALGLSYDWSRMVNTALSEYYKWDQWIFLKMLEKGLAYQKEASVNWCPKCNTVLANEQVTDGRCWRHEDTDVEVRKLKQWFFRTTDYAEELLENLDEIDWPERTKKMQENWIGRSEGAEISFEISGESGVGSRESGDLGNDANSGTQINADCADDADSKKVWKVFTTRSDTIFGVTFMVVAAGHERLDELVTDEQRDEVDEYLRRMHSVSEKDIERNEKEGVFSGSYAVNPANGEKVPIWVGNFVLADYGSGMVMGVPAHDKRDFDFARKYNLDIRFVINPSDEDFSKAESISDVSHASKTIDEISKGKFYSAWTGTGKLVDSGEFDGMSNVEAKKRIVDWLAEKGLTKKVVNFKLRDWGVSRQRYWGTPIPVVYCDSCGCVPVPESELPVELPKDVKFGEGNPLESNEDWIRCKCPKCGGEARRETDTMDTFVNSSWYFLRYADPNNAEKIFDKGRVDYWNPVDVYIGGAEHACMHLLYARFYTKFLRDIGMLDFDEPFQKLFHQGMLHAEDGRKMSKSLGNVVLPEIVSERYGIDTARFFLSSLASPDKNIDWNDAGIVGAYRFVKKMFGFYEKASWGEDSDELLSKLNLTLKNLEGYYGGFDYRKATIELRELFALMSHGDDPKGPDKRCSLESGKKFVQMIAPICPHVAEEIWERVGGEGFVSKSEWPEVDESKILKKGSGDGDLNEKIIERVKGILRDDVKRVYVYVMPFELERIDAEKIGEALGLNVKVFAVNDAEKVDPEGRARKAKPGLCAVWLE